MDTVDKKTRSSIMRSIKSKNTEPERLLAEAFRQMEAEPERHVRRLPGTPDFAFPKNRVAVFVDGDFWHGRAWLECGKTPATRPEYWAAKFRRNVERDTRVNSLLRDMGWTPCRFWGSDIKRSPSDVALFALAVCAVTGISPKFRD